MTPKPRQWRPPHQWEGNRAWWAWYNAYIHSPAWRRKRAKRLNLDGHQCVCCGASERLHVHHMTYDRVGRESLDDLRTVCRDCHGGLHERYAALREQYRTVKKYAGVDAETLKRRAELKEWKAPKRHHGTKIGGVRIVGPFTQDLTRKRRPKTPTTEATT